MRKTLPALLTAALTAWSAVAAHAATLPTRQDIIRLGFAETHLNYAEHPSKPYYDTENGYFPGADLTLVSIQPDFFARYNLFYGAGNVNYNGAIQNSFTGTSTPYQGQSREWLLSQNIDVGPAFALSQNNTLMPYVGLGVRYWRRKAGNNAPQRVHERYLRAPLDFGLLDQIALTPRLRAEVEAGGNYGLANLVETPQGSSRLGHNWGYKASLTLNYQLTGALGIFAQADYQGFTSDRGNLSATYYEPASRTHTQRYTVGIQLDRF